ncbi:MAG: hypothetical protein ACR2PL_05055 [Dehalococcoidia bacterium]
MLSADIWTERPNMVARVRRFVSRNRQPLLVMLMLLLLTSALFGPVMWHFNDWLYGVGGDGISAPRGILERRQALDHGSLFSPLPPLLGAPFSQSSDGVFSIEPLWWYLGVLSSYVLSPVGATNALVFVSFIATGIATYLFLRREDVPELASVLGTLIYTYCPIRLAEAQEHFTYVPGFPLVITIALLLRVRRGASRRVYAGLGLTLALTELLNVYLGYFAALLAGCWITGVLLRSISRREWRKVRQSLLGMLAAAITFGLVFGPSQIPLLSKLQSKSDPNLANIIRPMSDMEDLSLRWWHMLLPGPDSPLVRLLLPHTPFRYGRAQQSIDQSTTIGLIALILSLIGLRLWIYSRRRPADLAERATITKRHDQLDEATSHLGAMGLACVVVGVVFGLPPILNVADQVFLTPPYFLFRLIPEIRTTSRIDVLIQLGVALLAALGSASLLGAPTSRRTRYVIAGALAAGILLEYSNVPPWHYVRLFPAPKVVEWLAKQPENRAGIVAQYPLESDTYELTARYALYAYAVHHHPLFNGVTSGTPQDALRGNLNDILNPTAPASLDALGIRTVTLDTRAFGLTFGNAGLHWSDRQTGFVSDVPAGLVTAYSDEESVAYQVTSNPALVVSGFGEGFGSPELRQDGRNWLWANDAGTIWLDNVTRYPLKSVIWTEVHNNHETHFVQWPGYAPTLVPNSSDASAVAITAPIAPGMSSVLVRAIGTSAALGSNGQPVRVQLRSLEPAPVRPVGDDFIEDGRARWHLDGASTDACALKQGEELNVALLWSVRAPTSMPLTVFLHLVNGEGKLVAQADGPPNRGASPTDRLVIGAHVSDVHALPIGDSLPPGSYTLMAGLYDGRTGVRLTTAADRDSIDLGSVSVIAQAPGPRRIACTW